MRFMNHVGQMIVQMNCPNPFCASPIKDKYHSGQSSSFLILSCDINVNLISLSHFFDATMFCFENYNQGTDQIKNKNLKRIIPL